MRRPEAYGINKGAEIQGYGVKGDDAHGLKGIRIDNVRADDRVANLDSRSNWIVVSIVEMRNACGANGGKGEASGLQRKKAISPTIQ